MADSASTVVRATGDVTRLRVVCRNAVARSGSDNIQNWLAARGSAHAISSVSDRVDGSTAASTSSASLPRPCHANAWAKVSRASRSGSRASTASPSRSLSGRSPSRSASAAAATTTETGCGLSLSSASTASRSRSTTSLLGPGGQPFVQRGSSRMQILGGHLRARRVGVERMRRQHDVVDDGDRVGGLRSLHRVVACQRRQVGQRHRVGHGQELQRAKGVGGKRRDELPHRGIQPLAVHIRRVELDPRQHVVELQRRDRIRRALVGIDGDDQPHRTADGELVHQRRGQVVEQMRVVDDQQHTVGHRLAGGPKHRRRLAVVGDVDQVAHRRERYDAIGHRPGHPDGPAEAFARRTGHRRLARPDRRDNHRPAAVRDRRLDVLGCRLGRRGLPVDGHPPEFRVWPRRPCRTRLRWRCVP